MRILYEQSQNGGTVLDLLGIQNFFAGNMTHKWKTCAANSKLHSHAIYEIHILQKGSAVYEQRGVQYPLNPGNFLLLPPHTLHRMVGCSSDAATVCFSFRMVRGICPLPELNTVTAGTLTSRMQDTVELLIAEDRSPKAMHEQRIIAGLWELLIEFWRLGGIKEQARRMDDDGEGHVTRAKQYIADNVERAPTVEEVADYCHLSVRQLSRIFGQKEGMSTNEYIKLQQISRVRTLLQNSDMSLRRISERMNFASESYFSRFFKQHTGMTPGEYRNKMGTA